MVNHGRPRLTRPLVTLLLLSGLCGSLSGCGSSSAPESPGTPLIWTQGCGTKVQPTTVPGQGLAVELAGPKDSYQSYQIIVRGDQGYVSDVHFSWTDLASSDGGAAIDGSNIALFRQWFVDFADAQTLDGRNVTTGRTPVPGNSPTNDASIPDPLIPLVNPYDEGDLGQPFGVSTNRNQPIWVDVFIPKETPAGTYSGTISMTSSQGAADVPISVEVWDLELPDMRSVPTIFQLSIDPLTRYHSGTAEPDSHWLNWGERSRLIVKRYEELAHSHRIDTKQHFVRWPENECALPDADAWQTFDDEMRPYMNGTYWDNGVPSTVLQVGFTPGAEEWGLGTGCTQQQYTALADAWADHLEAQGWFDRAIVFALDEPPEEAYELIVQQSEWMAAADVGWKPKVLATIQPRSDTTDLLNQGVGIYCVNPPSFIYNDNPDTGLGFSYYGRDTWPELFDDGIALWFYDSNSNPPPYPNFATNSLDGLEPAMLMWGSWYERATGFLFWSINYWDENDPWGPSFRQWGKTGDGMLLYPGHHDGLDSPRGSPSDVELDGPIPSYRLKMIRLGLQDWALFALAEDLGLGDYARDQLESVYVQMGCSWIDCVEPLGDFLWDTDEIKMEDVRKAIAAAIVAAQ